MVTGFQLGLATTAAAIAALVTVTFPDAEVETENINFLSNSPFFTIVTRNVLNFGLLFQIHL